MAIVQCDVCGMNFAIRKDFCKVQEVFIKNEKMIVSYFICPKCDTPFIYSIKNKYIICGEQELERLYEEYSKATSSGDSFYVKSLDYDIWHLKKELAERFDTLMERYERFLHLDSNGVLIYSKKSKR